MHNNFLEEMAKFRAARRLWARIMKERFKAKDPRSMMLRFHAQTAGSTLTAQQPDNNVVRVALQAMAAVLGGASRCTPTRGTRRWRCRPRQRRGSRCAPSRSSPTSPAWPTPSIRSAAATRWSSSPTSSRPGREAYLTKIDDMGGMVRGHRPGLPAAGDPGRGLPGAARDGDGESVVVGVNEFREEEPPPEGLLRVDESVERVQAARLAALRKERDGAAVQRRLDALRTAAKDERQNLVPLILDAVKSPTTLGEISSRDAGRVRGAPGDGAQAFSQRRGSPRGPEAGARMPECRAGCKRRTCSKRRALCEGVRPRGYPESSMDAPLTRGEDVSDSICLASTARHARLPPDARARWRS